MTSRTMRPVLRLGASSVVARSRGLQLRLASSFAAAASKTLNIGGRQVSVPTGLFINNEFRKSLGGNTFPVENPATGEEIIRVEEGREEDVEIAVKAAREAFKGDAWATSKVSTGYRGELLLRLAQLMERDKEDIIALEMLDTGKTYRQAETVDFPGSLGTFKYYAGWADKIVGKASPNVPGAFAYTRREPVGVCGQIIPWNFPLMMFAWKIAPAIVTGNTVVMKSAEATPLSALKMCELIKEAGFPAGTVNVVSGYGKTVGNAIASHNDIDKVAFTGSTRTGRSIMTAAAQSNLKKVSLELGGKSPNIIFADADLDRAADWSAWGINMNYGQTCHAGTRLYVHEDVYDAFVAKLGQRLSSIKVGDNFDRSIDQGPVNSKMQLEKILGYIDIGKKEGATVYTGGGVPKTAHAGGYYVEPTIFTDVTQDMRIVNEEIFGPVITVAKFKTEEEVLELANDTEYGLASGIHTKDYARAERVTSKLQAGTAWVNMFNVVHWSMPFGGYKQSGLGRELGEEVLENYTETKSVLWNIDVPVPKYRN